MSSGTNNVLLVPMRIDALHVPAGGMTVRQAFADYRLLPYIYKKDGTWGIPKTGRVANLSSTILSPPCSGGDNLRLGAGVHLHWALPEALTHSAEQDDHDALIFPAVPSRWLVTRKRGGAIEKSWVVESDFLHPDLSWINPSDVPPPDSAVVPFPCNDLVQGPYQPFRFMGRKVAAEAWSPSDPTDKSGPDEYLGRYDLTLTATGVSETVPVLDHVKATFAGFYPNCLGVFGLHDDDASLQDDLTGISYDVLGWYADPARDCLGAFVDADPATDPQQRMDDFQDLYEWSFDPGDAAFPRRTVLHGRLTFTHAVAENPAAVTQQVKLSLGNTPTEALSAYLAQAMADDDASPANKPVFEEQLEAIQVADDLNQRVVDIGAAFQESRHTQGFTPKAGGILWSVQLTGAGNSEVTLPADLAHRLNQLNELQRAYDRSVDTIASLGDRLFADWCAWMTSNYYSEINDPDGPHGLGDDLPTLYKVVEEGAVAPQRKFMTDTGRLVLTLDPDTGAIKAEADVVVIRILPAQDPDFAHVVTGLDAGIKHLRKHFADCGITLSASATFQGASPTWTVTDQGVDYPLTLDGDVLNLRIPAFSTQQAAVLARTLEDFQQQLRSAAPGCALRATGAPRYWQPSDPVALLLGPSVVATDRFGVGGPLPCAQLTGPEIADADLQNLPADPNGLLTRVRAAVEAIAQRGDDNPGFVQWSMQPWNPFMLEWNADYNAIPRSGSYSPNAVIDSYALPADSCDLSPKGTASFGAEPQQYRGFAILTPDAGESVSQDLAAYLASVHDALPPPYDADLAGLQTNTKKVQQYLDDRIAALQTAYDGKHSPDPNDPLRTAIRAYALVKDLPCLAQALGGFNDALIAMTRTMQLDIAEPYHSAPNDYADSMRLAAEVAGLVGETLIRARAPEDDFSPIRGGKLRITGLHLVDSFGRLNNLIVGQTTGSDALPLIDESFLLAPRLTQPSRLLFRWLAATPIGGTDDYETNALPASSPICGWVLPNNLDGSLMVYDADGVSLGLVDERGVWMPAPGAANPVAAQDIENPYLRRLVTHVTSADDNGEAYMSQLLAAIDASLETIDPESFAQHQGLALLMGRPVALVRAAISLEVQGLPARDNSWDVIVETVGQYQRDSTSIDTITANPERFTAGFDKVEFPVRIGEPGRLNDGLVGYWVEDSSGSYVDGTFHAPGGGSAHFDGGGTGPGVDCTPGTVLTSLAAADTVVSMLVDPRGSVHATSGILPVKAVAIPQDQYADALKRIDITFLMAPILASGNDYDALDGSRQVPLPLPADPSYAWSWLAREGTRWATTTTFADADTAAVFADQLICEGWVKLDAASE